MLNSEVGSYADWSVGTAILKSLQNTCFWFGLDGVGMEDLYGDKVDRL
jgi:hypothetical protein